jgi:protoheme ferro-lyase
MHKVNLGKKHPVVTDTGQPDSIVSLFTGIVNKRAQQGKKTPLTLWQHKPLNGYIHAQGASVSEITTGSSYIPSAEYFPTHLRGSVTKSKR